MKINPLLTHLSSFTSFVHILTDVCDYPRLWGFCESVSYGLLPWAWTHTQCSPFMLITWNVHHAVLVTVQKFPGGQKVCRWPLNGAEALALQTCSQFNQWIERVSSAWEFKINGSVENIRSWKGSRALAFCCEQRQMLCSILKAFLQSKDLATHPEFLTFPPWQKSHYV